MQSAVTPDRKTALMLLAVSIAFGVTAKDIGAYLAAPDQAISPGRLALAFALAGGVIAILMLLAPAREERRGSAMQNPGLGWRRWLVLCALMAGYALTIRSAGFLLSTSVFLALCYLLLGERRWWVLLAASVPIAAAFELAMAGVFGIRITDPLLGGLGLDG